MDPTLKILIMFFAAIGVLTCLLVTVAIVYSLIEDRRVKRLYWGEGR